jgi:hypothetical protein
MPQVVDSSNLIQSITTGSVPEFKAPEAPKTDATSDPKTDAKPDAPTTQQEPKVEADKSAAPRGEDGKFVKAEGDKPAADKKPDAEDDVVLTRKIEKLINKKHREMREAQEFGTAEARRAIAAEQRAEALQRQIDDLQGKKSGGGASTGDGKPQPENFKTVGEYTEALVEYHAREAGKKSKASAETERNQAHANQVIAGFVDRQEAFKKATPDYEEVLESADFEVPPITQQYLVESEMGPQLAYHLAKNPDVVTSLRKLSPARQLAELGKLEAKLEVKPAPQNGGSTKNDVSKAPAPIQPLEAKSTPVQKKPEEMSFQELREFRRAEEATKRRA